MKNNRNALIVLNFSDNLVSKYEKQINKLSLFDKVIWSTWSKYKTIGFNKLSISSLVDFDQEIFHYINGYNVKDYKFYNLIKKKYFSTYVSMLTRRNSHLILNNPVELRNLFNIHYRFIEKFLLQNSIHYVILPPSLSAGFDMLIGIISKHLSIKTLFIENFQSKRFFYTTEWEDWGHFKVPKELFEEEKNYIYSKDPVKLFYLDEFEKNKKNKILLLKIKLKLLFILNIFFTLINVLCVSFFSRKVRITSFIKLSNFLINKSNKTRFILNRKKYLNKNIKNLKFDYVYFPLAYQPEATTLSFGDEYDDQLLALEKTAKLIPDTWFILIKEHPYQQNTNYRSDFFYRRIKSIDNVIIVPDNKFENSELITKSKFVVTISGNTGWESIRMLRPVLLFGRPWYLTCPGIVHFNNLKSYNDLLNLQWSLLDISEHIKELSKKMGVGLITQDYKKSKDIFNDFNESQINEDKNIDDVLSSLKKIIINLDG